MAEDVRELSESPIEQGVDERISYRLDTTTWGGGPTPTSVAVSIYDSNRTDLSSTKLSGAASIADEYVSTPLVVDLEDGKLYRLEIKFVVSGQTFEPYCYIYGKL